MPGKHVVKKAHRPLWVIAEEVAEEIKAGNWSRSAAFYALPYLRAMQNLEAITDSYLLDSGRSVVRYFLANAATWRGETARRIKEELRGMLV